MSHIAAVIPEFRASEISGTQGPTTYAAILAPGSRLSALTRSGRMTAMAHWWQLRARGKYHDQ
jgi:tRNA U55 pseudouridine synthase TruB